MSKPIGNKPSTIDLFCNVGGLREKTETTGVIKFDFKMPPTQYLGSKTKLLSWIVQHTPECDSIFDGFSGSNIVAYEFKKLGRRVVTNDYLNFSYQISVATVENSQVKLSSHDIAGLLVETPEKDDFVERNYSNLFYTRDECRFLDNLHANIHSLDNRYKRALALAAICRACIQKMPMGKFRSNLLQYRNRSSPHYRPKFARSIKTVFLDFLNRYNCAVFDNGYDNVAHNGNILDVVKHVKADAAYFDPPYCGSGYHYESDYFFLELYTKYYGKDVELTGKMKRYRGMQKSGFDKPNMIIDTLDSLFKNASHIPIWVISYNNRSAPGLKAMLELIERYRKPKVLEKEYKYKFVGNSGLKEYLLVCE